MDENITSGAKISSIIKETQEVIERSYEQTDIFCW